MRHDIAKRVDIFGALEAVAKARVRFGTELDALVKRHVIENELGTLDVVAVLEDKKFRTMMDFYDVAQREDLDDEPT